MKEVTVYKCEICGAEFAKANDASACEKSHHTVKEIDSLQYRSSTTTATPNSYPDKIVVLFDNNLKMTYARSGDAFY